MAKTNKTSKVSAKATIAKEGDGNVQITFTIPFKEIASAREEAAGELGKNIAIPGFRKGKAPIKKVIEHVSENALIENTLSRILPKLVGEAIREHNLRLAVYPRFELIKAVEGEDWQVRAITAELPEIKLGDYKEKVSSALTSQKIWTPDKGSGEEKKAPEREEKEQVAIKAILETVEIKIPSVLVDEEVNSRVSQLLSRLEKLGLNLESYLASLGKTAETLRKEYEVQAREAITLDLALSKIAEEEGIKVAEKEVDSALDARHAGHNHPESHVHSPEEKRMVEAILRRRSALDSLVSLM